MNARDLPQLTVELTADVELIRHFMTNPLIYRHLADDGSPPAEEFTPPQAATIFYLLVRLAGKPAGVFLLSQESSIACQVHTCLDPHIWGLSGFATRIGAAWIFESTPIVRINTQIPVFNKLAEKLAKDSGMTQYGLCPKAFLKGGKLWDIALYGMSKE